MSPRAPEDPFLRALGARPSDRGGDAGAADFGDAAGEERALREDVALIVRPARATAEVSGSQALDYLHRMLTQDLRGLRPLEARPALVLTREGRVLADPLVVSAPGGILLDWDPRAAAAALPPLERHVVADDVAFSDRTADLARVVLAGPRAPDAFAKAAGTPAPPALAAVPARLGGADVLAVRHDLGRIPALHLVVPRASLPAAVEALRAAGARLAGESAWDAVRVEEGVPRWGREVDERVLANEAGLEAAISWTKGCYVGQEPVVMARHRGHPPSLLARLSVEGDPREGSSLRSGDRRAGRLTTVVPRDGRSRALGYVAYAFARAGERLTVEDSPSAAVVEAVLAG
jgi:folate-binding protein YgfZ